MQPDFMRKLFQNFWKLICNAIFSGNFVFVIVNIDPKFIFNGYNSSVFIEIIKIAKVWNSNIEI